MAAGPLSDDERARIRELHAAGKSRNDIARDLGRSSSTITRAARELGLTFDRAATRAATAAKVADAKAKRAALSLALLDDAERLRAQLFTPSVLHSFGGADHTYKSVTVERPPAREQREIMQATSTAISASLRLDTHDSGTNAEHVGSLLGSLFDSMRARHGDEQDQAAGDDE